MRFDGYSRWGMPRVPIGENPLKKREDALWTEFSSTGVMPSVPVLDDADKISRAHSLLSGDYNQLQKVLDGEALARMGALSPEEADIQIEAAGWVLKIINSAKRAYEKKAEMAESFLAFKSASSNKRMALVCGLDKGSIMLKEAAEDKKLPLAEKLFSRLLALSAEDEQNAQLEEFTKLLISIGWTFAKQNQYGQLKKLLPLLPEVDYSTSEYFAKNIDALKDKMRFADEEPLRDWFNRVKAILQQDVPAESVRSMLTELLPLVGVGGWYDGPVTMKDGGRFESRQLALLRVCQLEKKLKNGIPNSIAQIVLQIFRKDGLQDLSDLFFERRDRQLKEGEKLPAKAKPYWPALSEDIARQIVSSCKVCYGKKAAAENSSKPDLAWAIEFLDVVYSRFTDDEWADFRVGKLMVWAQEVERAKERLLPVIRRKQSEYWAWELLGDIFPEKRKNCVARALICDADEIYVKGLKAEAQQLGLDVGNRDSLKNIAVETQELLLTGIEPIDGVLMEKFKTAEGKTRFVFSDGTGRDTMPLSPKAANLADAVEGCPVVIYRSPDDEKQIVAVKPRPQGRPWDVLPAEDAVFLESFADKTGKRISAIALKGIRTLCFREIKGCEPGAPLKVRFSDRIREGKDPECVWAKKDDSSGRRPWDVMSTIEAVFIESYSNDKGVVNVFGREGVQYKSYVKTVPLTSGDPVDIVVLGNPPKERIFKGGLYSRPRPPGTFLEQKSDARCYAVLRSNNPGRFKWDAMYRAAVVYCGKSKSGTSFTLSSGNHKFNAPQEKFPMLKTASLGAVFEIRYKVRVKDKEKIRDVLACESSDQDPGLTSSFSGTIRMASGYPPVGYVDLYEDTEDDYYDDYDDSCSHERHSYGSVFVSADFVKQFGLHSGSSVFGTAVRMPSTYHTSRSGNRYENERFQAITIQQDCGGVK